MIPHSRISADCSSPMFDTPTIEVGAFYWTVPDFIILIASSRDTFNLARDLVAAAPPQESLGIVLGGWRAGPLPRRAGHASWDRGGWRNRPRYAGGASAASVITRRTKQYRYRMDR